MEAIKKEVAHCNGRPPARISTGQPANGSRTRSITQKRRRAKYRRRRILALMILIALVAGATWGVTAVVKSIGRHLVKEPPVIVVQDDSLTSELPTVPEVETTPAPRYPLSDAERDIIERVVMAEAGGESLEGKMLVAQCILTAAEKTGLLPSEVVVKYKYTARRPEPSQSTKDAVAAVFDRGELVTDEPVMYFYNPAIVESEWHESQIFVIEVGGHRFFAERSQNNE